MTKGRREEGQKGTGKNLVIKSLKKRRQNKIGFEVETLEAFSLKISNFLYYRIIFYNKQGCFW